MKNVYAIIVIYNGMKKNWIQKCFDSIFNSSIKINIIAIDNVSTDESVQFIKKNYPSVELIENQSNDGFGKANNIGIKRAFEKGADYFFLLNQDAWIQERTVEVLLKNSIDHPDYGILSPIHMNGEGNLIDQGFYNCVNPYKSRYLYSVLSTHKVSEELICDFDFVPAACWLLSKKIIEKIGGFNPTFYHYGEDDNYVHRIHYFSLKVGVVPSVKVYHDREERPPHVYFDALLTKYKRKVLLDISNPLLKGNRKLVEYRLLLADLFKALLFFDKKSIKLIFDKFKVVLKIKKKEILKNKKVSEKEGMNFL
ncbi:MULTISPECIES: glycosyltransferase [unclassified Apibacter]|uniref:glycosyltransferase n=1 Tax=unclassified Apibacter TaxID=2630820 RepID=UPI00132C6607|nr:MULTISPECIES: glycosyltransferase family 2 protein [unclassified Apibacter]MCX8677705.1 glycosyltransferase family 2 protein [Apibacter sp. B3919]MXO24981.1 glycosyltransferase [Apibacter sp. B3924]MXO27268.1 glycosyltransferase [Apibacter sp. B3813]MXO29081.1 glycosyltransferase [Apibacter sp. B3913]MXO31138.1 glycosyltransferase [Apibacter sp. B3912]